MARKVTWAPRAFSLLEEAAAYVEEHSPSAARQLVIEAIEAAESLKQLPERGRFVPELRNSLYREIFVQKYRLIYQVGTDRLAIVAFVHGSRDFRVWWKRFRRRDPN
ncbi:MAG TPA: type II toxin-antitoxin system RelE/ParE family toxin [Thermoanaerobaculia bacterium]